jgi:hypothetical protein
MRKLLLILVTGLFFLVIGVTSASAQTQAVLIQAGFVDGKHYSIAGQSYPTIGYTYMAADQYLVQEFIDNVNFSVTFLDPEGNTVLKLTPEVVRQLWSDPTMTQFLIHHGSTLSRAYWKVPISELPPGDYEMHTIICLPFALSTEYDANGDGEFDVLLPEDCNREYVVYIHITS